MTEDKRARKSRGLESGVEKLHLEHGLSKRDSGKLRTDEIKEESASCNSLSPQGSPLKSASQSPYKKENLSQSPPPGMEKHEEIIGGEVTVKQEPGQPPKLSRSISQRITSRAPLLFQDHPDKTKEAKGTFELISECSYTSKWIGSTEHDSMDCDCAEEWGKLKTSSAHLSVFSNTQLILTYRQLRGEEFSMWSRLRLHKSCNQNGVCRRLWMWS